MVNKLFGSVFGNVEQHITTVQEEPTPTSQQPSPETSPVYLAKEPRGFKIDLIRVINVLYMLGFFTGKNGAKVQCIKPRWRSRSAKSIFRWRLSKSAVG